MPSLVGRGFHPLRGWPKALSFFVTGSIARSAMRRYLMYSEANFEVFRPAGATRCTDGGEIRHGERAIGPSSMPNFSPLPMPNFTPLVQLLGYRTHKLKFLPRLIKMWNINAPQGRIPCTIFTKFVEFVPRFRMC